MFQQFLMPPNNEEIPLQDHFKERLNLLYQITRKLEQDFLSTQAKTSPFTDLQNQSDSTSYNDNFSDAWNTIRHQGFVTIESIELLYSYWEINHSAWLVNRLINELIKCKYIQVSTISI